MQKLKLKLSNITKTYYSGEAVTALKSVSLEFRANEFVAILGPSGCGKTTLLNVIGGLDHYDSSNGDLVIDGTSTSSFKDADWDAYRNRSIGFVFQNYNLIAHQTVLQNVEIAMTLSGVSTAERRERATEALTKVGLADQIKKKPGQLSGGQMQRVAIARALVNNPDIILADEPTGALDSQTSIQLMEVLKEIAQTRLVIMVTHNGELAQRYSSRLIRLLDGEVQSDSNPPIETGPIMQASTEQKKFRLTSMSLKTAAGLSLNNLLTKRGRTIITAFAGSIGIIGVALVLALSNGLSIQMKTMQADTLSGFPITISTSEQRFDRGVRNPFMGGGGGGNSGTQQYTSFPDDTTVYNYDRSANQTTHTNVLSDEYLKYISSLQTALPGAVNTISYRYSVGMNILADTGDTIVQLQSSGRGSSGLGSGGGNSSSSWSSSYWQEMPSNDDFILSLYDLIGTGSRLPTAKNEIAIVVDEYNRLPTAFLTALGLSNKTYAAEDFLGKTVLKIVDNDDFYTQSGDLFVAVAPSDYQALYDANNGVELTVVGVLRIKADAASSYFSEGFIYTTALTDHVLKTAQNSQIAKTQKSSSKNVLTGAVFADDNAKRAMLLALGADSSPTGINIYPVDFAAKDSIKAYLDSYNVGKPEAQQVIYSDMAETISSMTGTLINTVSLVLVGFAAISLVVSTIMIGIITYVSVIERTREIGILRSVGARKKDISRVFNAEAMIIGLTAGAIGVALAYLASIPISAIIANLSGLSGVAALNPIHAVLLIAGSMALTLIAAFFPSRIAARKDPVEALRAE